MLSLASVSFVTSFDTHPRLIVTSIIEETCKTFAGALMQAKTFREDIKWDGGYTVLEPPRAPSYNWRQNAIMRRVSFALIVFAVYAALLSFCVSIGASTTASADAMNARAAGTVTFPDLYEASISELQEGMEKGHFTSEDLVKVSCCFVKSSEIKY